MRTRDRTAGGGVRKALVKERGTSGAGSLALHHHCNDDAKQRACGVDRQCVDDDVKLRPPPRCLRHPSPARWHDNARFVSRDGRRRPLVAGWRERPLLTCARKKERQARSHSLRFPLCVTPSSCVTSSSPLLTPPCKARPSAQRMALFALLRACDPAARPLALHGEGTWGFSLGDRLDGGRTRTRRLPCLTGRAGTGHEDGRLLPLDGQQARALMVKGNLAFAGRSMTCGTPIPRSVSPGAVACVVCDTGLDTSLHAGIIDRLD